ncbi:MAG TPA: 2-dehydropantoate 2-reductase [Ktedonobacterales bacterium]|nr:2-dehydropantoate 2-reductase [Ktedonobacterales bacterium]
MRIAIVGVGGVGGYFGARLAHAGEDVVFMARGEHLRAILATGLRLESADGAVTIHPAQASDDPAAIGPVDVALVAVKGWQVPEAIVTLRPLVGAETLVVPLLNGVEAPDQLAAALGRPHVAAGLCGLFGSIAGPGHIRQILPQPYVTIGELDDSRTPRIERLHAALARTGARAAIAPDIRAALWEKLLMVGPLGAVGAVTRAPAGVLRAQPETRALLDGTMREVLQVARGLGVAVAEEAITRARATVDGLPPQATASMQRDVMAGRPSELETQIGAVVRAARQAGVAAPLHDFFYATLLPQERRARGELDFPA